MGHGGQWELSCVAAHSGCRTMSLMLPTRGRSGTVTRYEKAKPIEEEAPVHLQRSYYDFVEAQIVDHLTNSSSLDGPVSQCECGAHCWRGYLLQAIP